MAQNRAAGEAVAKVDPLGRRSTTVYDLAGRTVAAIDPLNERTTTVYDAAGEAIARLDHVPVAQLRRRAVRVEGDRRHAAVAGGQQQQETWQQRTRAANPVHQVRLQTLGSGLSVTGDSLGKLH